MYMGIRFGGETHCRVLGVGRGLSGEKVQGIRFDGEKVHFRISAGPGARLPDPVPGRREVGEPLLSSSSISVVSCLESANFVNLA